MASGYRALLGTWIGESAAKLAGYKDRTEELARADKMHAEIAKEAAADRARLAASIQAATDKQFELSKAARAGVAEFEKLTKEGASSAEAIKKVGESFDLGKIQGVKDFSAVLDKLSADGKVSATEFEAAWAQALNGKDLAQFEVMARAAFSGAAREGERVAQMMDAVVRESVKRTGLDFDVLQGKIGAASRSAINDVDALIGGLDKLQEQGVDTGRALTASLSKAIASADSEKALEAIRAKIEQVRAQLGDKIADGLLDQAKDKANALKDALDAATPGITSVREAMKTLGITSDESLKKTAATAKDAYDTLASSGTASARELGAAFKKAAEDAIAANNGVAPSWVESQAAARGYAVEVDAAGKTTLRAMGESKTAVAGVGTAVRDVSASLKQMGIDAATASQEVKDLAAAGQMLAAAEQARRDAYNKDLEASKFMNRGNMTPVDAVPTFNTRAEADAWKAAWDAQYAKDNPFTTKTDGFGRQTTLAEWNAEVSAMENRNAMKSANGGTSPALTNTSPTPGTTTGTTVNITVEGTRRSINTDAAGARDLQELIRQLTAAKGAAI